MADCSAVHCAIRLKPSLSFAIETFRLRHAGPGLHAIYRDSLSATATFVHAAPDSASAIPGCGSIRLLLASSLTRLACISSAG